MKGLCKCGRNMSSLEPSNGRCTSLVCSVESCDLSDASMAEIGKIEAFRRQDESLLINGRT